MPQDTGNKKSGTKRFRKKYNRSAKYIATKAIKEVKKLKGEEEKKFNDNTDNNDFADYDGKLYPLLNIAAGTGASQRVGQKITAKHVNINGVVEFNGASPLQNQLVRVMLIEDTEPTSGATPSVSDILHNIGATVAPLSPLQYEQHGRFKTLRTMLMTVNKNGPNSQVFNMFKSLNKQVYYDGGAANGVERRNLYLLAISDVAPASNPPYFSYYSRLIFTDN